MMSCRFALFIMLSMQVKDMQTSPMISSSSSVFQLNSNNLSRLHNGPASDSALDSAPDSAHPIDPPTAPSSAHNVSNGIRNKREASDAFNDYHSKMTMASRIFSGIALRIGLHDGSVNGDSLISELLNLKSINLDDVEKFDKAKLDQFFKDVAGLDDLPREAVDGANKIRQMDSLMQSYTKISNPMDSTVMDEYIGKVKAFTDANVDFSFLKIANVGELKKLPGKKSTELTQTVLQGIKLVLEAIEKLPDDVNNLLSILKTHEDLLKPNILESDLVRSAALIRESEREKNSLIWLGNVAQKFSDALTSASSLSASFNHAKLSLELALGVAASRSGRKVAHGFVNGFSDVVQLRRDFRDTWLSTVIEKYDHALVKSELKVLEKFELSFENLDGAWSDVDDWSSIEEVAELLTTFESASKAIDSAAYNDIMQRLDYNNAYAMPFLRFTDKVINFRKTLIQLRPKLDALLQMNGMKELKNLTAFHKDIDFSHSETADQVLQRLPSTEHLNKLVTAVETVQTVLTAIDHLLTQTDPSTRAREIEQEKSEIQAFLGHADRTAHFQYFDEVKALRLGEFLEPISLLKVLEDVKKKTATFQPALEVITTKIAASIADFKALRAVPAAIKATKSKRIEELVQLKSIERAAKTFGDAVMVLDVAEKVLSQKLAIERMLSDGWTVDGKIQSKPNKEQLANDWGEFAEMATYFATLLTELENKTSSLSTSSRARRQTVSLKDMVDKLTALQGLPDFNVDLKPKVGVLRQLTGGAQLLSTMESLAALDLKFSSHQSALASAGQEVDTASKLFGSIVPKNSSNLGGKGDGKTGKDPTSSGRSASGNKDEKAEDKDDTIKHVIGGILGVIAVAGIAGGAYGIYRCFKKDPPKETTPVPANDSVDGSKTDEDKKGGGKQAKSVDSDPMGEVDATPKLADLEKLSTKTARAKTVVEENFDMSAISEAKRAMANDYKDCVQVMMEDEWLKKDKEQLEKEREEMKKTKETETEKTKETWDRPPIKHIKDQVKVAEKKMPELKKKLGDKLAADVEKFAKVEYEEKVARIQCARRKIMAELEYDKRSLVIDKREQFEKAIMTPLTMCRETVEWKLVDGVWVPPERASALRDTIAHVLISFEPHAKCLKKNPKVSPVLNPFYVRLTEANIAVDKLNQPFNDLSRFIQKGTVTNVLNYCKYNVQVASGKTLNASWFKNKYGKGKLIVCAVPGALNEFETVHHMLWQENVQFTCTAGVTYRRNYFNRGVGVSQYKVKLKSETVFVQATPLKVMEQKIVIERGDEKRVITNYEINTMHCNKHIYTHRSFREAMKMVLRKVTRQEDKNTVFFDPEGSCWAGTLAGVELISSSLSHDGLLEANVTTQLTNILTHRGHMFTQPDQVMFMFLLAVDMFCEDHKLNQLNDAAWIPLEKCHETDKKKDGQFDPAKAMSNPTEDQFATTAQTRAQKKAEQDRNSAHPGRDIVHVEDQNTVDDCVVYGK